MENKMDSIPDQPTTLIPTTLLRLNQQSRWYQRHPIECGRKLTLADLKPGYGLSDVDSMFLTPWGRRLFAHLRWEPTEKDRELLQKLNQPRAVAERKRVAAKLKEKKKRQEREWDAWKLRIAAETMLEAMEKHGPAVIKGLRVTHDRRTVSWSAVISDRELKRLNALQEEWLKAKQEGLDLTEDMKDQMVSLCRGMARTVSSKARAEWWNEGNLLCRIAGAMADMLEAREQGKAFTRRDICMGQFK